MNETMLHTLLGRDFYKFDGPDHRWSDYFGIEFEIENSSLMESFGSWSAKHDGSLRNGVEFVSKSPYAAMALSKAIDQWYAKKINFTVSGRCSTHIHVNMMDASVGHLRSMVFLMYCLEDAIYNLIGEHRKWAGYSMPLSEMGPGRIRGIMTAPNVQEFFRNVAPPQNQERYYGFNTNISRHGTVEFRHFPGGLPQDELTMWLDFITQLKKAAFALPVLSLVDIETPEQFVGVLRRYFDTTLMDQFLRVVTPEQLYSRFGEIAAISVPEEGFVREEPLVFLTGCLKKYALKQYGTSVANKTAILRLFREAQVLTTGEFQRRMRDCRHQGVESEKPMPSPVLRVNEDLLRWGEEAVLAAGNIAGMPEINLLPPTPRRR